MPLATLAIRLALADAAIALIRDDHIDRAGQLHRDLLGVLGRRDRVVVNPKRTALPSERYFVPALGAQRRALLMRRLEPAHNLVAVGRAHAHDIEHAASGIG